MSAKSAQVVVMAAFHQHRIEDTSRKQLGGALKSISSAVVRKNYRDMDKASLEPPVVRVLLYSRMGKFLYMFLDRTS